MRHFSYLLAIPFLIACNGGTSSGNDKEGDSLHFKYAKNITVVKYKDHTTVEMMDPWNKGKVLHSYTLVENGKGNGTQTADGSTIVCIPLCHSLVSTSVHCELTKMLHKKSTVAAVCDAEYFNAPWVKQALGKGSIVNCGSSMSPNIEKIITLRPDAILLSPMQNTGGYGKIENLGIPIIELADYMEPAALGRAEWIKVYGIFFGAEQLADSLFNANEKDYIRLKSLAAKSKTRKKVLIDKIENGTWYLPGGESTIAKLLADANCNYPYSKDKSAGSITKSRESVVAECGNCDTWLIRYGKPDGSMLTIDELKRYDSSYSLIDALKKRDVWGCNTAISTFFEETPFQPQLLLRDFIIMLHPDIKGLGNPRYFSKLK